MRTVHVVAGLEDVDGGPSHTLPQLWSHLAEEGIGVEAYATAVQPGSRVLNGGVAIFEFPRNFPKILKRAPELRAALQDALPRADLCHNHGCWLYPNWAAGGCSRRARRPLVISPLGHLDAWSRRHHAVRKWAARFLFETKNWNYASAFIAKSSLEADQLAHLGLGGKTHVIPNALHRKEWESEVSPDLFWRQFPALRGSRLMLFLSRVHPKKGLRHLLKVWRFLAVQFKDWQLVVVGDLGNAHAIELSRHVFEDSILAKRVTFLGELEGDLKRSALRAADLFALPSHSENFGQVVLEALASGTPVLTTHGCPWSGIEQRQCGWWIPDGEVALRVTLIEALGCSPQDLRAMGKRGRDWVLNEFDGRKVAKQMKDLYGAILGA